MTATDPLHQPLPKDRAQAKALAEQMAARSTGGSQMCAFGDHPMFYAPYDVPLVPGHIYSEAGLKEAGISGTCEACFDGAFADTDHPSREVIGGESPFDDDDKGEEDLAARQDECDHDWKPRGYNPNFGQIYECEKCEGVTP